MGGQPGRDVLIRIGDGASPERFVTVAGIRTRTLTLSNGLVDATSSDSPGAWRELLAGAGTRRLEVSGAGVFKDAASDELLRAASFAGEAVRLQLVIPDFGMIAGAFVVAELSWGGEHDGEATMAVRLSSAGELEFGAAP
jgi:TP901-1 family phage major tail protein